MKVSEGVSFQRLGQRIADLSRELSDITKLAGQAPPSRKLELEAASAAFKSLTDAYARKPEAFQGSAARSVRAAVTEHAAGDVRAECRRWRPTADRAVFRSSRGARIRSSIFIRRVYPSAVELGGEVSPGMRPDLSETERRRAAFFIRQATAAMAPSNLLDGQSRRR